MNSIRFRGSLVSRLRKRARRALDKVHRRRNKGVVALTNLDESNKTKILKPAKTEETDPLVTVETSSPVSAVNNKLEQNDAALLNWRNGLTRLRDELEAAANNSDVSVAHVQALRKQLAEVIRARPNRKPARNSDAGREENSTAKPNGRTRALGSTASNGPSSVLTKFSVDETMDARAEDNNANCLLQFCRVMVNPNTDPSWSFNNTEVKPGYFSHINPEF